MIIKKGIKVKILAGKEKKKEGENQLLFGWGTY